MWRRNRSFSPLLEPQTSSFNKLNKSVKDFLANPVDTNTYWINKLASWHLGSDYVAQDGNDQADSYKAAFPVHCEDEEQIWVKKKVLFATFLSTSWHNRCDKTHYISTRVTHIILTLNKTQINRRYIGK
jgi:hypothetical protein